MPGIGDREPPGIFAIPLEQLIETGTAATQLEERLRKIDLPS
jgi:hypothetical protein